MMDELCADQLATLDRGRCPDCDHRGFVLGPRGGLSQNIECGNLECRSRFNISTSFASHRIAIAHRIPREAEGGSNWDA
jgi:hypothetical protein